MGDRKRSVKGWSGISFVECLVSAAFVEVQKEGASGSNGTASAIAKTLGPALDQMLSGLLKGMKPIFKDVCTNVVEDVALQALEQNESGKELHDTPVLLRDGMCVGWEGSFLKNMSR